MSSIHLTTADTLVLFAYLTVVFVIGIVASRRIKTSDQYFLGGRKFSKWIMIGQSFGTGTHAEMPVSLSGAVYSMGLSAIWFQWKNLFVTPFYWLLAPLFRRFRRTTMAEVFEDRYGSWMAGIYTFFALTSLSLDMASMVKGAAKVIEQALGGEVPVNTLVVGMTCVFVAYSFIGGLLATAWTDFLQGFLIIALSFMLLPLGWHLVGGMAGMKAELGATKFMMATPDGIGIWMICLLTLNGLVGIVAQPHLIAAVGTGRDENACRVGHFYGNMVKRICTIGWALVGLMAAVLVAKGVFGVTKLEDPELAFGFVCRHLLFTGGIGLLIACLLAANMAGCSAFMVDAGALATNGIYRRYFVKNASDKHYLVAGKVGGLLVTLVAVIYAVFGVERVLNTFLLTETMATFVGVSVLAGIVWKRANRWGAIGSIATAMTVNFVAHRWLNLRFDNWDPNIFFVSLLSGISAMILISLLTPAERGEQTEEFFLRLKTPSDDPALGTALGVTPAKQEELAAQGRLLILVNLLSLRKAAGKAGFFRAYRTDLKGLLIGFTLVGILIGTLAFIVR